MQNDTRFQTGVSTTATILKAIPLGTILVLSLSGFLFVMNIFFGGSVTTSFCIASTSVANGMPWQIINLFLYQLVHHGFYHQLVTYLAFPLVASNFESKVGTFQFLHIFFVGGAMVGSIYVVLIWLMSFMFPSWGTACIGGLDVPFFIFLTTEALAEDGLYELTSRMGLKIANFLYPLLFVAIFFVLMPFTSWLIHIFAIVIGFFHFSGTLDAFLLSSRALNYLDTTPKLRYLSERHNFVMKPGDLSLPIPGSFPTNRRNNDESGGSFLTQLSNAFRSDRYAPIQNYAPLERQADPLMWEDQESPESPTVPQSEGTNL